MPEDKLYLHYTEFYDNWSWRKAAAFSLNDVYRKGEAMLTSTSCLGKWLTTETDATIAEKLHKILIGMKWPNNAINKMLEFDDTALELRQRNVMDSAFDFREKLEKFIDHKDDQDIFPGTLYSATIPDVTIFKQGDYIAHELWKDAVHLKEQKINHIN